MFGLFGCVHPAICVSVPCVSSSWCLSWSLVCSCSFPGHSHVFDIAFDLSANACGLHSVFFNYSGTALPCVMQYPGLV